MQKRAFTLIELLVAISIIAMLLAILTPAMRKAREQAEIVVCKSQLHQFGLGGTAYLVDNNNRFCDHMYWLYTQQTWQSVPGGNPCKWHDPRLKPDGPLWPYIKDKDVKVCPAYYRLAKRYGSNHPGHDSSIPIDPQYSYSMNGYLGVEGGDSWAGPLEINRITEARHPARTIFFCEENLWLTEGLSRYCLNDTVMLSRTGPGVFTSVGYTENDYCDCIASFHDTRGDETTGESNIAFLDGSVGTGRPEDSFKLSLPRPYTQ